MTSIPHTVQDKAAWIDLKELDDHGNGLTQFEIGFVESLTQQLLEGKTLSERQLATLHAIREDRL